MTREEANKELERAFDVLDHSCHMDNRRKEAFNMARMALSAEPCEDAISRADTIEWLKRVTVTDGITFETGFKQILTDIQNMPSVTPKQKMGKWIDEGFYAEGHSEHAYRCSECDEHYIGYVGEFKYCPNCGAKMGESEDKEW